LKEIINHCLSVKVVKGRIEMFLTSNHVVTRSWFSIGKPLRFLVVFPAALLIQSLSLAQDTTAPQLKSLTISPSTLNLITGPSNLLTVTMHVTDDLSGADFTSFHFPLSSGITFRSPSGAQVQFLNAFNSTSPFKLIAGTPLDGLWQGTLAFPNTSESGVWTVEQVQLIDVVLNVNILTTAALQAAGFPTTLTIISNPDTSPPKLVGLHLGPTSVNVSFAQQSIGVVVELTDDISGVDYSCRNFCFSALVLQSPSGQQTQGSANYNFSLSGGSLLTGAWSTFITLPRYSETGTWKIAYLYFRDGAGNAASFDTAGLQALGFPTNVQVVGVEDTTPPQLGSLSLSPTFINTSVTTETVTINFQASDNLSGLDFLAGFASPHFNGTQIEFVSPSGQQRHSVNPYNSIFAKLTGTPLVSTWQTQLTVPQFSEQGTWKINRISLKDEAGNYRNLDTAQLHAMGVQTDLIVVQPSLAVDGTITAAGGTVMDQVFGSRAQITVPPGLLSTATTVAIDVLESQLSVPTPQGFSSPGTRFVNIDLEPHPTGLLPAPGITAVLPLINPMIPGSRLTLYRINPATNPPTLVPATSVTSGFVVGTVNSDGLSATFSGIASLSTVVGLISDGTIPGDLNGDGTVNCIDVAIVKASFGKRRGETGFDARADENRDGVVDINDLAFVTRQLPAGTKCP
jgi:hypothetical protein